MRQTLFIKAFIFLLVAVVLFGFDSKEHVVYADACSDATAVEAGTKVYCRNKRDNPLVSILRTIIDWFSGFILEVPTQLAVNSNVNDTSICGCVLNMRDEPALVANLTNGYGDPLYDADSLAVCQDAIDSGMNCEYSSNTLLGGRQVGEVRSEGSLMGFADTAYTIVRKEPIPVNLAYYFKHNLQKIPVVNRTALAATTYNAWGVDSILGLWETTRNFALALMSVIMLVIGFMIITRKKINPQAVVTVQTAIPRVIIALILITFSYPIGALMASAIGPITIVGLGALFGEYQEKIGDMNYLVKNWSILTLIMSGGYAITIGTIMLLMTLIGFIAAVVKSIFVMLRILIAIILAPLIFAFSAIPGQEHLVSDWFKQMAARVLAIPGIFFTIGLAWYVMLLPFLGASQSALANADPVTAGFSFFRPLGSLNITFIITAVMSIMVMFMSVKVPSKIEEFIMGDSKKRR